MSSHHKPAKHSQGFISECRTFAHEMMASAETNINEHNRMISHENRWDDYVNIRSHNTFVEGGENVPGITLKAYKCIRCQPASNTTKE